MIEPLLAWASDALVRSERIGDPVVRYWAADYRKIAAGCAGDIAEVDRCLVIAGSLARQLDQPTLLWAHLLTSATRALVAGDADEAERLDAEAHRVGLDGGEPDATVVFRTQRRHARWLRGTLGGSSGPDWLTSMAMYAAAAIVWGDARHAASLIVLLEPWKDQLIYNDLTSSGPVSHYLGGLAGILARHDEADDDFAQASAFSERLGAKFFAALTDLSWGSMLGQRGSPGDLERAQDLLARSRAVAAENGYVAVGRHAVHALNRLR